jgi:hypothetical protein
MKTLFDEKFFAKKIIFASFFRAIREKNDICGQKKENDFVFQLFFTNFFRVIRA